MGKKKHYINVKSGTSWQDTISDWLVSIIVAVALAFCIRTFVVEPYMVEGTSMYPTLESHERLIVSKYKYFFTEPKKGEIVVFRYPKDESRDFIKRVIAKKIIFTRMIRRARISLITENLLCLRGISSF